MTDWRKWRRRLQLALTSTIIFALSGWLSGLLARQASGLEALWAGNAVLLGMMIARHRDRGEIAALSLGGLIAGVALHVARQDPPSVVVLLPIANVVECLVALAVLRAAKVKRLGFRRVSDVISFGSACGVGAAVSASIGAVGLALGDGAPFVSVWLGWYLAAVLSQLVLTPMILLCAELGYRRHLRGIAGRSLVEVILVLGLVATVTALVFFRGHLPLLFLISPPMLVATFRLRAFGAVAAMAIVAVIATYATALGLGPIARTALAPADQLLLLQLFMAVIFLSALPVAAMLAERDARAEEARLLADRFQAVVENIGEVIFRTDADGAWVYLNPAWEAVSGHAIAESLGQSWLEHVDMPDRDELIERITAVLRGESKATRRTLRFHTAHGVRWMELYIQGLSDPDGRVTGTTGTLRDIDDRKRLEEHVMSARRRAEQRAREATRLAATDELTGIANRRAFLRQLDREIEGATEFGWPLAVAMFDVDHFKEVNDRFGHGVGDRVLQLIAARAATAVRSGDVVGRLGGEEFGILMPGATADEAVRVAERLRQAMETPRDDEDGRLPPVTVSVGIAARDNQADAAALLAVADAALYSAKSAGRNRIRIAA